MARDNRFDHRSKSTFEKDVKFGTHMETYFFNKWSELVKDEHFDGIINLISWNHNGVDNSGGFIPTGQSTFGADYKVTIEYCGELYEDLPLEVKWVPTAGKLTLKKNDLKAYQKENAAILFIYNTKNDGVDLRKPRDYNVAMHLKKIEKKADDLRWGIMFPEMVDNILHNCSDEFKPISYMGGKPGIIIKSERFGNFFDPHYWSVT